MVSVSPRDFEAHVRRHFPGVDAERAYARWRELLADRERLLAQADAFLPENQVAWGLSWWEERQGADARATAPITDLDHASMMLTLDGSARPRPHCPAELVGAWTLAAVSSDGAGESPPVAPRRWTLGADGSLDTGDAAEAGWTWRVHRGRHDDLWFGPARRPDRQHRLILARTGDRVTLSVPGSSRGHEVWRIGS